MGNTTESTQLFCKALNENVLSKCEYIEKYVSFNNVRTLKDRVWVGTKCLNLNNCTITDCEQKIFSRGNSYIPNPKSIIDNYDKL